MNNKPVLTGLFLLIVSIILSCDNLTVTDTLKEGFINPPDSSRPGVYWYFMDGNLDRRAITADLESMKNAGIGYVLFLEVNVGVPRGNVDFLSDQWQDIFTHAVRECERLGIRLILGSGPGWAGSGGPWVKPSESMMHLVASDTVLTGPSTYNGKLPVPMPKKPFFGEESLTPSLRKIRDDWYEDVRVLAFPTPERSEKIADIDYKALYYRAPYTSQAGVPPYIPALSGYPGSPEASIRKDKIIDLTNRIQPDGSMNWMVPPGKWTVMRFVKRNNGAVTRPAPLPGLGFESDKFDTSSFSAHYRSYVGKLINKARPVKTGSGGGWTMIHIDSWEMGAQNWSDKFLEQFIKRRGYDPLLFLPVYAGYVVNSAEESERFLWDLRQTSNEMIIENHAGWFKQLGRRNGFLLSIEPYDMNPAADLDLGTVADVPMGEFWSEGYGFNSAFSCIEAASIAHVTGKQVVAAEAFTADHSEAWKKYPGNMKDQTDWALAMGINRFIFHTFAHKPLGDQYLPGMTMGPYGVHWDRGQTWWPMVSEYHKYLSRCQFVLSQGRAIADILYLAAEGAPHVFRAPSSALDGSEVLPDKRGFSFDGCSPRYLISYASADKSRIVFPGGASYSVLVLPDTPAMTPELVAKIELLIKAGAVVIGYPPSRSPSLANYPQSDAIVKKVSEMIWGTVKELSVGLQKKYVNGQIYHPRRMPAAKDGSSFELYPPYSEAEKILKGNGINEDFISGGNIRYLHRSAGDREIYFISNRTAHIISDSCFFRDGTPHAELWDPLTGGIHALKVTSSLSRGTGAKIMMNAWQSYFVVFNHSAWTGRNTKIDTVFFGENKTALNITGPWKVRFDKLMGGPEEVVFDTLCDWISRPEEGIRYYSGIAEYSAYFTLPDNIRAKGKSFMLDLGSVKNIAGVRLNGKDLGIIWTSPAEIRFDGSILEKNNQLFIKVANLWINRLIGDETKPWDGVENGKWPEWLVKGEPRTSGRYTFTTHRFYKKDDPLSPSGLLGPVLIKESER